MVKHFLWGSVQPLNLGDKLSLREVVDLGIVLGELWSAPSGNKKMIRFEATFRTQPARQFETDERAHAVAEERERSIEK